MLHLLADALGDDREGLGAGGQAGLLADFAAQGICQARFEAFGCAGQASRIQPMALDAMVRRYR